MALQVWLPLNGNLENKGLSNITVTNNGATVNNTGKIGKCYSFGGANIDTNLSYDKWNFGSNSISFGGWFKFNKTEIENQLKTLTYTSNSSPTGNLLGANSYGGFAIVWTANNFYTSSALTSFTISSVIRNSNSNYHAGSITADYDTWVHLFTTYDKTTNVLNLYKNGTLVKTTTIPTAFDDTTFTHRNFFINKSFVWGGNGPSASIPCLINDVRVYDHCLCKEEIKDISKTLVLHYPFNDPYIESTTNLGKSSINYSTYDKGIEYDAGSWGGDAGKVTFYDKGGYNNYPYKVYHKTATGSGGIYRKTTNDIIIESGKTYTMSVYVKASRSFSEGSYSFNINGVTSSDNNHYIQSGKVNFTTEWQRLVYTFTATSADAGTYGEMSIIYNDDVSDYYVYYSGFQIEEKDHATPFTLSSRSESTVYDTSGYGNDGTINGNITITSDAHRYALSSFIPSATTITHTRCLESGVTQEWTCCAWIKSSTITSYSYLNNFNQNNGLKHGTYPLLYLNSGDNDYYIYGTQAIPTGSWVHVAFVFKNDGGYRKIYINGVDTSGSGPNKTNTPSGIPSNIIIFGGEFEGNVSDYREYATALTANDIQELYNTSAKICKNGTLMCYEIKED